MSGKKLKILVAPLNWGIGHATRSVPIIDKFLVLGHEVHIASDGDALKVLRSNFPDLPYYTLASLEIRYSHQFILKLLLQFPKLILWYYKDKVIINKILKHQTFDLIISDSRPAIRSNNIKSVIIIHQVSPIIPWYLGSLVIIKLFHSFLKNYNRIWIPDLPDRTLSGSLSHVSEEKKLRFVGFLSHITNQTNDIVSNGNILAIISGPEPSRSYFEKKLKKILPIQNVLIVGGTFGTTGNDSRYISFVDGSLLIEKINLSEYVITRGGYSTLMDLAPLSKRLILVPTKGQTEQEYLANRLVILNMAIIWDLENETLDHALDRSNNTERFYLENDSNLLTRALKEFF